MLTSKFKHILTGITRAIRRLVIVIVCAVTLIAAVRCDNRRESVLGASYDFSKFQDGDLIFQTSTSEQSKAIQLATKSRFSHVGLIYIKDGKHYVYEAVQPVKLTKLTEWIRRGKDSRYVVKRLRNSDKILSPVNVAKIKKIADRFNGKDYDIYFGWSDDRIYCSELVWKIYKEAINIEIGTLQELREFDLSSDIVKSKMKSRYGDQIPLDEKVISPSAMFESKMLITVAKMD